MTSLTTLFVVGPEEYVEFNESMGSKAFVEHIWDQSRTPLKVEDTSASGTQLHSAGARISIAPPPRIEFPTVLRQKGRGNKYKLSGRYISWEELKRKNPIALKDPPSLEEFINKGSQIGTAERLEPGAFLKGEKRFKLNKKQKGTIEVHESQDGWIGGSSESVYAPKSIASGSSESMYAPKPSEGGSSESIYATKTLSTNGGTSDSIYAPKTTNLPMDNNALLQEPKATSESSSNEIPRTIRKSRSGLSLWARLGMEASIDDVEKQKDAASSSSDDSTKKHSKIQQRPGKLTLPDNRLSHLTGSNDPEAKTPIAQTPLSATHTPPETPLKRHENKDRIEIPPTPNTQERFAQAESSVSAKGGLMLDPGQSQAITPTISEPPSLPLAESTPARKTAPIRAARNQMDEMLARLRQARSGLSGGDSSESIWAPKKKQEESSTSNCTTPKAYETTPQIPLSDKISEKEKNTIKKDETESKSNIQKPGDPPAKVYTKPEPVSTLTKDSNSGGKSLFDRLGPKFEVKESKPAAKKERKRGGRNHTHEDNELSSGKEVFENAPSSSSSGMKETKFDNDSKKISKPEPEKLVEPVKASNELQTITNSLADESNEKTKKTSAESKEVEKLDVVQKADEISSPQKVESVSQIGNDTFTSFDWADDDDESLPELTEEWMKVALLSSPSKTEQAKSIVVGESEIGESVKAESTVDNNTSSNASKRERKGRAGKREKDRGVDERNANPRKSEKTSSVNQGIRIAGTANSNQTTNDAKNLSTVPPWQRRSMATSPPKEPLGLRIAGRASEIQPKSDKASSQSTKFKKNITPSSSSSSSFNPPPPNRGRGFVGSVMPPNATPLHAEGHPFLAKSESNTSIKPDNSSDSHSQNGRSRARGGRSNRRGSHGTDS